MPGNGGSRVADREERSVTPVTGDRLSPEATGRGLDDPVLWTRDSLMEALGLAPVACPDFDVRSVAVEPEGCMPGTFFIAVDRHEPTAEIEAAIRSAVAQGAVAVLTNRDLPFPGLTVPVWQVAGYPQFALRKLARVARDRFTGKVVGVCGSIGKTSTTRFVHQILGGFGRSSSNNRGNPGWSWVTVANAPPDFDYLAVELPVDRPGTMAAKAGATRPHVGVMTNIGISHLSNYPERRGILREKAIMLDHLTGDRCAVVSRSVLEFDDSHDRLLRSKHLSRVITVGTSVSDDLFLSAVSSDSYRTSGRMSVFGASYDFVLPTPGRHFAANALLAVGACCALGLPAAEAVASLANAPLPSRRVQRLRVRIPDGFLELIDDSYNAAPASVRALLAVLGDRHPSRKVLVLGDMLEIGPESERHHEELAPYIAGAGVDVLVTVGPLARRAASGMGHLDTVLLDDAKAATSALPQLLRAGDLVAVKGSNAVNLDRVVAAVAPPGVHEPAATDWHIENEHG